MAEIFQNREQKFQHVGKCIAEYRRASHAILMHRRGFSTFHRECVASQRVAGPIDMFRVAKFESKVGSRRTTKI